MRKPKLLLGLALTFALSLSSHVKAAEYYVSAADGASDDNPGTKEQPWKTCLKAGATAKAGDTVYILAGTYRDNLQIMNSGKKDAPIKFIGVGDVLITGAEIHDDFKKEGKLWVKRPWTMKHKWYWGDESTFVQYAHDKSPFASAARMENVFINGMPMQWVPTKKNLAPGRFYWNGKKGDGGELLVYPPEDINQNPDKNKIEIPVKNCVLSGPWGSYPRGMSEVRHKKLEDRYTNAKYIEIKNITFGYTKDGFVTCGAFISGDHWTVDGCTFQYMNAGGFWIGGNDAIVRNCVFKYNGKLGLCGKFQVKRALIEDCIVMHNNRKFYQTWWDAGGIKLHHAEDNVMRRIYSAFNFGASIWYDIDCERNILNDNTSFGNDGLGLFYEVSEYGTLKNNVSFGNSCGIMYAHSATGDIQDNVLIGNNSAYILGGARGPYGGGITTNFMNNLIFETLKLNVGWKWSKKPDSRSKSSKNIISKNVFAVENGSDVYEVYSKKPGLANFESQLAHSYDNKFVRGLDNLNAENRAKLDNSFKRVIQGLNAVEPRIKLSDKGVKFTKTWVLGGKRMINGYWLETSKGPVLILIAQKDDSIALVSEGAKDVTMWSFPHLGLHRVEKLKTGTAVIAANIIKKMVVITGLSANTKPLKEFVTIKTTQNGEAKSAFKEGETINAEFTLTNSFEKQISIKIDGPAQNGVSYTLAPGETKTVKADVVAKGGVKNLLYNITSNILAIPVTRSAKVHVAKVVVAKPCADESHKSDSKIEINTIENRNMKIWDEVTGKSWKGPKDVSGYATVSWNEKSLNTYVNVTDNKVWNGKKGFYSGDGVELFIDGRQGKNFRKAKYDRSVKNIRIPAPKTKEWAPISLATPVKSIVKNSGMSGQSHWRNLSKKQIDEINGINLNSLSLRTNTVIEQWIKLNPDWGKIKVITNAKYNNIVPGSKNWHTGRVTVLFQNDKGKKVGGWPPAISFKGTNDKFKTYEMTYKLPEGSHKLRVQAGMWSCKSGALELNDIIIIPIERRNGTPISGKEPKGIKIKGRVTNTGYEIKANVDWSILGGIKPAAGKSIGFDVSLNDNDYEKGKALQSQLLWQGVDGTNSKDPSAFGYLMLAE